MIRYRTATLALSLVCLLSGAHNAPAQDFLQDLFGSDSPPSASHRAPGHRNDDSAYRSGRDRDRSRAGRAARGQAERPEEGARSSRTSAGGGPRREDDGAAWGNGTEFCVRTCDGYFFPLIKSAQQTKQASCEYACPSAPVAYYHGASIETARNLNGEKYTSLPNAFKFREKVSAGCTCHPPEESQQHSLKIVKNDPTAHSGDIVVEQKGAFVYQGKQAVPIDRSHQLSASQRQNIHKMTAGPAPAGGSNSQPQKTVDGAPSRGAANNGLLSGAARPMGELDAASVNSGEADHEPSWVMPALLAAALLGGAAAALRLTPGLKDRLRDMVRGRTTTSTTIDLVDATTTDVGTRSSTPLAWVWSEYRGVQEPVALTGGSKPSPTGPTSSMTKDPSVAVTGECGGFSPTSIAWVWSEYRGAL